MRALSGRSGRAWPTARVPAADGELVSQLLGGEVVTVYDEADGWAWVQNDTDGYVGYTPAVALRPRCVSPPT